MKDRQPADTLEALLTVLSDPAAPLPAALIYRLSDLVAPDLELLRAAWLTVPVERRQTLLSKLAESSETNFDLDFATVAQFALQDEDATVRKHALAALWTSEDLATMRLFVRHLQTDEATEVRAAAAEALGRFVLVGELGNLPEAVLREAEDALLEAFDSEEEGLEVQRRTLESLAYSGREEVRGLIDHARQHESLTMQATALFAMGRSADERWAKYVIAALSDPEPQLRYEAARAAGELGLASTVPRLIRLTRDADREIREAAIWSLGEIGGAEAQNALLRLADQTEDSDLLEAIEDAVNNATLSAGDFSTYLLSQHDDLEDEDDLDDLIDDDDET